MGQKVKKSGIMALKAIALPAIIYLIFLAINFSRVSSINFISAIFQQSIIPTIVGYALSFGYFCGVFDFAIGSRMIIANIVGFMLSVKFGIIGLLVGCIVTSLVLGAIVGAANWICKVPSMVVTLGFTMIFECVGQWIIMNMGVILVPKGADIFGSAPYNFIALAVIGVIFYFVYNKTRFSKHTLAVGNDEALAKVSGINIGWTKFLTFIIGGVFLGLACFIQISYAGTVQSNLNLGTIHAMFKPLIGVLIGMALKSIYNPAVGIFIGQVSMNIIFLGLVSLGVPDTLQEVFLGAFLMIVVVISENKQNIDNFKARMARKKMRGSAA